MIEGVLFKKCSKEQYEEFKFPIVMPIVYVLKTHPWQVQKHVIGVQTRKGNQIDVHKNDDVLSDKKYVSLCEETQS